MQIIDWSSFKSVLVITGIGVGIGFLIAFFIIPKWVRDIRVVVIIGIAWGIGLFMECIMLESTGWLKEWIESSPGLESAYNIIHLPALGLCLFLAPGGDEGWSFFPYYVVVQWVLVGVGVALWWCRKNL